MKKLKEELDKLQQKQILDNSQIVFTNNGQTIELARNMMMKNEIQKAKNKKFPEYFSYIDSIADEYGPAIESFRTPPGELNIVKRRHSSSSSK